ncbi:MAG: hypothetical protein KC496_22655, partial [Anaerolineae bacterium]|nr:hypothetical protein [Anaerolineae bacterium]
IDHWRLEYDPVHQTIYVMESNNGITYNRAFCWRITVNEWGEFSERHVGLGQFGEFEFGYIDRDGYQHVFEPGWRGREITPTPDLDYDLRVPLIQKTLPEPSTSCVSNSSGIALDVDDDMPNPPYMHWFVHTNMVRTTPVFTDLDSFIEFGYLVIPAQVPTARQQYEIQDLIIAHPRSAPEDALAPYAVWNPDFDVAAEDWLSSTDADEDWNTSTEPDEDWNSDYASLQANPFVMRIRSSPDGITFDQETPELARFALEGSRYTCLTAGRFHTIRVLAQEVGAMYHVTYMHATIEPKGEETP